MTETNESPTPAKTKRVALLATAGLVFVLAAAIWWAIADEEPPFPEDQNERIEMFKRDLRDGKIQKPEGTRKPLRTAYRNWLREHGVDPDKPRDDEGSPPPVEQHPSGYPVVDFGKMKFPEEPPPTEPERIEPNEFLDDEDLRHPEIFFEMAKSVPEYNRLEERRDVLDFFERYQEQLKGDLKKQLEAGASTEEILEIRTAIGRYDEAIKKMRDLVREQELQGEKVP